MALNYIWIGFFVVAFVVSLVRLMAYYFYEFLPAILQWDWALNEYNKDIFSTLVNATFDSSKTAFEISLYLTGALALWMGIMKIGEEGGMVRVLSKIVGPFFNRLFPEVPKDHPAGGSMLMNFSANMLGLDNAATPLGLKAMKQLQELNPNKDTASNAQIMFLVLNTSGLTVIPVSVMVIRAQQGAVNPAEIFLPILLATFFSTMVGLIVTSIYQRINLFDKVIMAYLGSVSLAVAGIIWYFSGLSQEQTAVVSSFAGNFILFGIIMSFIGLAVYKKVNVYDNFIEGAKGGFAVAIKIIPYLVAMLVGIAVFRASGALDLLVGGLRICVEFLGINSDFVDAMPVAFMKPLSGSGARGAMVDIFTTPEFGVESFQGKLAATFQGSTETTFYTLAVYFGSVGIRNSRYAVTCGLIADLAGITAAIFIAYLFFH